MSGLPGCLLIANRGEIAVRIMRTCKRLGIRAVAVYSDADRDACHVRAADEAIRIGPAAARDSYLRPDAIMDAVRRSGADGVHPGYGFLSEKPDLPLLCQQAGRIFVGPSADCITAMGAKIGAKLIAAQAGVPCVPGYLGDDQSDAKLAGEAERLGYPIMIKASSGGGGRGMRRVFHPADLLPALGLARLEAAAAFGDPALLIERLVQRPRHLEVQVAGDKHGQIVHLFERDCSVQRNNQKLLEEAPAPNLPPAIRAKLLDHAVSLARAVAYDNLGTVEFILEQGQDEPWFLEMNTRLQVEHPVTEAITGLDLVEWQIRIASGERLPLQQAEILQQGHAIEARITAERADQDFRPQTGRILLYRQPPSIRVDSGIEAGSEITPFYDPLLAKGIAHGATREAARKQLADGLRDFVIQGPATTLPFLADMLDHPIFASGQATTRFLDDAFPGGWQPRQPDRALARAAACLIALHAPKPPNSPWEALTGFRLLGLAETRLIVTDEDTVTHAAILALPGGRRRVTTGDGECEILLRISGQTAEIETDGRVIHAGFSMDGGAIQLTLQGDTYGFRIQPETSAATGASLAATGSGAVLAATPGIIAELRVAVGDIVSAGQAVAVLESMKLFASVAADISGTVTEIFCQPGEAVPAGKLLIVIQKL